MESNISIVVLTQEDSWSRYHPFTQACNFLASYYQVSIIKSNKVPQTADLLFNNIPFSNETTIPEICYLTEDDYNFSEIAKINTDYFASSRYLSKKYKCTLQYPYFQKIINQEKLRKATIIYQEDDQIIDLLKRELSNNYIFKKFIKEEDMDGANLYVSSFLSGRNSWHPSIFLNHLYEVPGVYFVDDDEEINEFIDNSADKVFSRTTINIKKWLQEIKIMLRDGKKSTNKKLSNLELIAAKVKELTNAKNKKLYQNNQFNASKNNQPIEQMIAERNRLAMVKRSVLDKSKVTNVPENIVRKKPKSNKPEFIRKPYLAATVHHYPLPNWLETNNNHKISIIVPMYRSSTVIAEQIKTWTYDTDCEIIYVNDCCPEDSHLIVGESWESRKANYPQTNFAKVVMTSHNSGYGVACNCGASVASGEILVFLNADTIVTNNWLINLLAVFDEKENVGIVGNLILRMDGTVDSAGSEWMWDSKSFEHIGSNVISGKRVHKRILHNELPAELKVIAERIMVTGCCFAIKKDLFDKIGGFDVNYRIGYWEDADICMKVIAEDKRIYYTPKSVIYHKSGHSQAGGHPYITDNAKLFYDKWITTKKLQTFLGENISI